MYGNRQICKGILIAVFVLMSYSLVAQNQAITAWGRDNHGQVSDVPAGNDFAAIAAKGDHSLALRQDGSLVAWGLNTNGQCNVPAGNDFASIATGNFHSLAIRNNGTIAAWGQDTNNQVSGTPTGTDFVAVSGGYYHSLALRENGSLAGWGANSYQQCNVPAGNDFIAVEAGGFHSIALRDNGTIVAWGRNWNNVLNVPAGNDFVTISAGYYQNIALRSDGSIVVWGGNQYNQVDHTPIHSDFIDVSTGLGHSMALREDGSIMAWGAGEAGGTGLFDYEQSVVPPGNDYAGLAAGRVHSLALIITDPPSDYTLTISAEGEGTTLPEPGAHVYDVGEEVLISAIPDDDWLFDRWVINGTDVPENPYTVTMNSNITAIAHFVPVPPPQYTLTIEIVGEGGTIPQPGDHVYDEGTEVQVTANQSLSEWPFSHWMINGDVITDNPATVTILSDITATAHFILLPPPSNLTAIAGDGVVWLEWEYPEMLPDFVGYYVYRDEDWINDDPIPEDYYEDTEVENGVTYSYYVVAAYPNGISLGSNIVEVTPEALYLPPPTDLVADVLDYSSVRLLWDEPDIEGLDIILTGYNIYRNEELINPAPVLENNYVDCCLLPDQTYTYYVTALYDEGESEGSNIVEIYVTNVGDELIPELTRLHGNYPNPFNPETMISFTNSAPGQVIIEVYNSIGQKIRTLTERFYEPGNHTVSWDGRDDNKSEVSSGIYFFRMQTGDYASVRKMLMIK